MFLGLFADSHMSYAYENNTEEPSLEEMTERAIKILAKTGGDKGFFLFVEGGKIDMAHHTTQVSSSRIKNYRKSVKCDKM